MAVTVHSWANALEAVGPRWAECVAEAGFNPSLHPQWMNATLDAHGLANKALVACVTTGAQVAYVPLIARTVTVGGLPLRCLDLVSNVVSYHAALVATGEPQGALDELLRCSELPAWDVLRITNIVTGGATATAVDAMGAGQALSGVLTYPGERSPYIDMSPDWSEYLRLLPKKVRANITRCIRQTQQAGETGMVWYEKDADVDRLLADMLAIESRSWKASDDKAIRSDRAEGRYYQTLLPWLAQNGLFANVLYVNHQPCAYVLCAKWRGWVGQLKTSFAQDVRDAGFRVIHASIERAFADKEREYDFLGDAAPHKLRWTDRIRAHEDRWLFAPHLRGRALLTVKKTIDAWRRRRAAQQAEAKIGTNAEVNSEVKDEST